MIQTDCLHYIGDVPCVFHKKYRIECNENCQYYKRIGLRILIIKMEGIGDVLRNTPILYSIKEKYGENTHITWLTEPNAFDILKYNPLINRIYKFDFKTLIHLEEEEFDILFNLEKDRPALGLAKKIKAKQKYGFSMNKYGNLITFGEEEKYAHRIGISDNLKDSNVKSIQQFNSEILELPYSPDYKFIFDIPNLKELVKKKFREFNIDKNSKIIGFVTGANPKFLSRLWPKEYFVELGIRLIKEHNFTILLFGAKTEEELNNFIYNKISSSLPNDLKDKIINTGINNTLLEFAAMISAIDLTIAGDTLGLNIAIALEAPSISFFGPTSPVEMDVYRTGIKLVPNSECKNCYAQQCYQDMFCLETITVDEVFNKILEYLEQIKEN